MNADTVYVLLAILISLLVTIFLPKYVGKKAENLATKEDISEITDQIESVKMEYANLLASTRAELSAQINTHGFRYEKEYEVLDSLTELLVEVRDAALSLRPVADYVDPNKSEDEIKQERLERFVKARSALYLKCERKRPFFPDEIYRLITEVRKTAISESIQYRHRDSSGKDWLKYWDDAEKNQAEIASKADAAMEKIRERITKWETLTGSD